MVDNSSKCVFVLISMLGRVKTIQSHSSVRGRFSEFFLKLHLGKSVKKVSNANHVNFPPMPFFIWMTVLASNVS